MALSPNKRLIPIVRPPNQAVIGGKEKAGSSFDKNERRTVAKKDVADALASVLLAARTNVRSENKEPSKAELAVRYRLDRKDGE